MVLEGSITGVPLDGQAPQEQEVWDTRQDLEENLPLHQGPFRSLY